MEAGVLPMRNVGQKGLCVQEPHRALQGIIIITILETGKSTWEEVNNLAQDNLGKELM